MTRHVIRRIACVVALSLTALESARAVAQAVPPSQIADLGLQRYWDLKIPLPAGSSVARVALVDENFYLITDDNRAYAIHAGTGVVRWANVLADPGQTVRGPTHARDFVYFTTSAAVRVMSRHSGDPAGEPRRLRGVVIDVQGDRAEVNIGWQHGVRIGETLAVYRPSAGGEPEGAPVAMLSVQAVQPRYAQGRLEDEDSSRPCRMGDRAVADVLLPLPRIKLPFAASCAAVADDTSLYVGAANQRFYCLEIVHGFQQWQLETPRTVSATPIVSKTDLIMAGQDGRVVSCTKKDREKNWIFQAEGPIVADPVLAGDKLLIAGTDRSLYCLDAASGRRLWRERFDQPLRVAPAVGKDRLYLPVTGVGLICLETNSGKEIWRRPGDWQHLVEFGKESFLWRGGDGLAAEIARVDSATGREKSWAGAGLYCYAGASQADQLIIIASRAGDLVCLRSKDAPHLKPEQLAAVLKNDNAARIAARMIAEKKKPEAPPEPAKLTSASRAILMTDWFTSRATGRPAGYTGLVEVDEAGKPDAAKAKEEGADEDAEGDEATKDERKAESDDESGGDSKKKEEGDDEDGEDEGGGDDEGSDEEPP